MSWSADLARDASDGREKWIATAIWPRMKPEDAVREWKKQLADPNSLAWRIMDALTRLGDKDVIASRFDERVRELNPARLIDDLRKMQAQLELFGASVTRLATRVEEVAEEAPLRRQK